MKKVVLRGLTNENVPDSFSGNIGGKKTYRMFRCEACHESFKRAEGVLYISGFFCEKHNPANRRSD